MREEGSFRCLRLAFATKIRRAAFDPAPVAFVPKDFHDGAGQFALPLPKLLSDFLIRGVLSLNEAEPESDTRASVGSD